MPRVRAVQRNARERDRAAGNALPPPFSPRAAECNQETETKGYAQRPLDGNEDCPAAGPAERVERN